MFICWMYCIGRKFFRLLFLCFWWCKAIRPLLQVVVILYFLCKSFNLCNWRIFAVYIKYGVEGVIEQCFGRWRSWWWEAMVSIGVVSSTSSCGGNDHTNGCLTNLRANVVRSEHTAVWSVITKYCKSYYSKELFARTIPWSKSWRPRDALVI